MSNSNEAIMPAKPSTNPIAWKKFALVAGVIVAAAVAYFQYGEALSLSKLVEKETGLRDYQLNHPVLAYGWAFLIYVLITGLSLPGAVVLTMLYGWYFGLASGILVVSFASTTGATLAFLLSRFLFRDAIQNKFGDRLAGFNESLAKEGPFYLFTLRLIPAVPFFVINAVMGLTPIKTWTFWWVSQLGMLAGTAVYVYAGSAVPSLQALAEDGAEAAFSKEKLAQITVAFVLLGTFPLIVRHVIKRFGKPKSA